MSGRDDCERDILVVDSSVVVKWFKSADETSVEQALDLLSEHRLGTTTIVVPGHLPAEVLNALQYAGLELADVNDAAAILHDLDLVAIPLSRQLTQSAVELARTHRLTINDALFPALAVLLGCGLVTADRTQAHVTECPIRLLL